MDLVTGGRAYTPIYQAEMFWHNNSDYRAMHAAYLKRLFRNVPLDGLQVLNPLALSYEGFVDICDWVMLENCGLGFEPGWAERTSCNGFPAPGKRWH